MTQYLLSIVIPFSPVRDATTVAPGEAQRNEANGRMERERSPGYKEYLKPAGGFFASV
jgi:hypothetical protein